MYVGQAQINTRDAPPQAPGQLEATCNQFMDVRTRIDYSTIRAMQLVDRLLGSTPRDVPKPLGASVEREPPTVDKLQRAASDAMDALRRLEEELQHLESL